MGVGAKYSFLVSGKKYIFTNNWYARHKALIQLFFEKYLAAELIQAILEKHQSASQKQSPLGSTSRSQVNVKIRRNRTRPWPEWETPDVEELKKVAYSLTPHLKFLHPDIIAKVTEANKTQASYFSDYLSQSGIDTTSYVWDKCSTMFPGIRRANGKTDNKYKKQQLPRELREAKGAIYIDDNSYAKHLWAFIFTGRQFSNIGPAGYELAHLFEHKAVERMEKEVTTTDGSPYDLSKPMSGMFTSAAGLVYAPRSFVKITDHSLHARRLLQRKAMDLYNKTTNVLPPSVTLKEQSDEWDLNSFDWGEPVGDPAMTDVFLEYRMSRIQAILDLKIPARK